MTIYQEIDIPGPIKNVDRVSGRIVVHVTDPEKARLIVMVFEHAELLAFSILGNEALG